MSFTLYGLYALHPTLYTIYMDWGANSLINWPKSRQSYIVWNRKPTPNDPKISRNFEKNIKASFVVEDIVILPRLPDG